MSITTATSVPTIRHWNTVRPTGMDTGNIKAAGQVVQRVHIWHSVPEAKTCQNDHQTYMGTVHGNMRGYQTYSWDERTVFSQKRNHRKNLWNCKRESWITVYADVWQSPNGYESRAHVCVHEFEETGKNQAEMGR